jgi:hypothetical protein
LVITNKRISFIGPRLNSGAFIEEIQAVEVEKQEGWFGFLKSRYLVLYCNVQELNGLYCLMDSAGEGELIIQALIARQNVSKPSGMPEAESVSSKFQSKQVGIVKQPDPSDIENKLSLLKASFDAGILTSKEFEQKRILLKKQDDLSSKLTLMEQAKEAGLLTAEEFETKKAALLSNS